MYVCIAGPISHETLKLHSKVKKLKTHKYHRWFIRGEQKVYVGYLPKN